MPKLPIAAPNHCSPDDGSGSGRIEITIFGLLRAFELIMHRALNLPGMPLRSHRRKFTRRASYPLFLGQSCKSLFELLGRNAYFVGNSIGRDSSAVYQRLLVERR